MEQTQIETAFKNYTELEQDFEAQQLTSGHLNQTFKICNGGKSYLLQKLNTDIFKNLDKITSNNILVSKTLKEENYKHDVLEPLAFRDGAYLWGGNWRLFPFFDGTQTFLKVESRGQAYEAAKFLSEFHSTLKTLNVDKIQASIEGFLDFNARWNQFCDALKNASEERLENASEEIEFVQEKESLLKEWRVCLPQFPERLIHADPKISNFLFDASSNKKVRALIDWDTFMCGPILYDFGDMVRSYTGLKDEDDPDTKGPHFSKENYEALKSGFLYYLDNDLTEVEKDNLELAGKVVIYVQILRFLADYLNGDTYYSVTYENHNLDRTRSQINLLKDMIKQLS